MKIVVMSDSHGSAGAVFRVIRKHTDADLFIHLGDGAIEVKAARGILGEDAHKLRSVRGNCDAPSDDVPLQMTIDLPYGHKILAAHGHAFQIKASTGTIRDEAHRLGCDILLYGHTHVRQNSWNDGLYIVNPGSLSHPRDGRPPGYAVISVSEKGILVSEMDL